VSLSGLAVIFFMGINLLSRDFEKRTIYMILSRPIARWQYVLGKFFGLTFMVGTSVAILGFFSAAGVKATMLIAPPYVPPNYSWLIFILSIFFSYLSLIILTAIAQLFTCLTTSSYIALLITACTYFIGQNVEIVRNMFDDGKGVNEIYAGLISVVTWVFPNLQAFDLKTAAGYGLPLETGALIWTAVYGLSYVVIVLALTILVFQRRELS
jgi:ABC-type transport system involved in multi-copper enzyme maturation permease subunit